MGASRRTQHRPINTTRPLSPAMVLRGSLSDPAKPLNDAQTGWARRPAMCSAGIRSPDTAMCRGFSLSGRATTLHMSALAYEYATGAAIHHHALRHQPAQARQGRAIGVQRVSLADAWL